MEQFAHVHCIQDIDYDIIPDASFHSLFYKSGTARILKEAPAEIVLYLEKVFELSSVHTVWAILLEFKNQPIYVVRNLAHSNSTPNFRRVLRVDVERINDI